MTEKNNKRKKSLRRLTIKHFISQKLEELIVYPTTFILSVSLLAVIGYDFIYLVNLSVHGEQQPSLLSLYFVLYASIGLMIFLLFTGLYVMVEKWIKSNWKKAQKKARSSLGK